MADNIAWQKQSFNPVKMNPSIGFASAAKSFSNINQSIRDKEAVDSLAEYRLSQANLAEQELDYKLGAEERAIAEEDRILAKSAERGLFGQRAAKEAGGSRVEPLMANLMASNDPRLQGVDDLEGKIMDFADNNKAAVSDKDTYRDQLKTNLLKSGQYSAEQADAFAEKETTRLFPTMSGDMMKASMQAVRGGPGGSGSGSAGGTGTFKPWSQMPSAMDENDIHKNFMEMYPVGKGENANIFGMELDYTGPFGAVDVTGPDIRKLSTSMKQEGINPAATYAVVEKYIQGNNLDFDPTNMSADQKTAFKAEAEQVMAQQAGGYNSKTGGMAGSGGAQTQQDYYGQLDKILARGTTQSMSDDELVNQFLGGLGDAPVANAPANAPILPPAATQAPVPAPTPAPAAQNIMPEAAPVAQAPEQSVPAMMGSFAKTGLEVNAEGVKMLKWLSDQTGQATIDLVKSFKNAPEWLAQFKQGYQQ